MTTTPERTFVTARTEFQNVFGDLAKGKRNWQLIAFGLLAALGLVLVAFVRLALTSRITPYVVEVDRLGRAVAFGPAEPLASTDRRIIIAQLATFLKDVRTVVPSMAAQQDLLARAYALTDQHGAAFLNDYFSAPTHDPIQVGRAWTRTVEVTSLLPVPSTTGAATAAASTPTTWKAQWTETAIPTTAGGTTQTTAWEGYLTVRLQPPTRADVLELNPLGLYVTAITWAQIAGTATP